MKNLFIAATLAALTGCTIVTYPSNSPYAYRPPVQPIQSTGTSYHLNSEYFPTLHVPALSKVHYGNNLVPEQPVVNKTTTKPVVKGTAGGYEKVTYVNSKGKTVVITQTPAPKQKPQTVKVTKPNPVKTTGKKQTVDDAIKQALDAATPAK